MAGLSTAKNKPSVPKEKLSFKNFFSFLGGWFIRNKLYFLAVCYTCNYNVYRIRYV